MSCPKWSGIASGSKYTDFQNVQLKTKTTKYEVSNQTRNSKSFLCFISPIRFVAHWSLPLNEQQNEQKPFRCTASDVLIRFIHICSIYLFKQSVSVLLHKQWFARPCAWWYYHLWKCLHVLAWTMQQEYVTAPPAVRIAMISAAWRKSPLDVASFSCFMVFHSCI